MIKISTRSRYGLRAMVDIALHSNEGTTQLSDIANRQALSPKYLDHILSALRKVKLIKNVRGRFGGYKLTKSPSQISIKDIVLALEDSLAPVECVDNPEICHQIHSCYSRDMWVKLKDTITETLESTTLQNLIESQKDKRQHPVNYTI